MKKPFLSFRFLPASWGLVGDAYEEAEAHYTLAGEDLDRRLLQIRHRHEPDVLKKKNLDLDLRYNKIDPYRYALAMVDLTADPADHWKHCLEIDVRFNKLSPYEAAVKVVEHDHKPGLEYDLAKLAVDVQFGKLTPYDGAIKTIDLTHEPGLERDLAVLEADHKFGHIEKKVYEKRCATMKSEPWVAFLDSGFDLNEGLDGVFFELDWNPQWIDFLRLHGYIGHTEEQVVEDWFSDVCKSYSQAEVASMAMGTYPVGLSNRDI